MPGRGDRDEDRAFTRATLLRVAVAAAAALLTLLALWDDGGSPPDRQGRLHGAAGAPTATAEWRGGANAVRSAPCCVT